tara:strand:+ start:2853 stop:3140 length:288 start_codon:yes stop_codon:yes gene_type:complete
MIIENVLFKSKNLQDFVSHLKYIIFSCEESIEMFCASLNAKKILKEISKCCFKSCRTFQFVIYNNNEVSLYTGNKKDISFFEKRLNWKFKELNNG